MEALHCIQNRMSLFVANTAFYIEIGLSLKYICYS